MSQQPAQPRLESRNPRDYDLESGSCGVVNEKGHGCRPLILADHAAGSAIMGDGSIDGRGGAKLMGQDVTWWDVRLSDILFRIEIACAEPDQPGRSSR